MFKTYDSDIEGITNKLGFSKRSFAEWGEQVSSAFAESEGKMNKFKNTLSAVFVPQKDNTQLIGDFQAFKDLMLETGLSAEELSKEIGGVDSRIVSYAKSGKVGKLTTDGFKESIGNLSLGAKAGQVALKGLALAGNALAMALASWVATEIISWLNDLAHAEENARKRSEELTSSYEDEKKNIDDSIAKYKELSEKLNDSSLSTSEIKSIKDQLLSVQDQLNEKYGAEATQIDLVNGKYDEQIKKLDKLAKKKASDYVAENYSDIKEDQKYVSEKFNVNKSLGFKGSQAKPDDYSNSGFDFKKYLDRYDKLDAKVINPDGQYGMTGDVTLITNGTRQEVYDQISSLLNDLNRDFGESNPDVVALKTTLSNILKDSFDTNELAAANDRIKKYAQAEILSNDDASESYNNLVDAVDNYNTALSSGKGVDDAKQKLLEAKQAAEDSTKDITNSGKVLQDVYNSLDSEAPIELQVEFGKNVDEDLQQSYEDTINRFKNNITEDQTQQLEDAKQNLEDEYKKISDCGLDDYADQIKNDTIQTKFGNVDMDKRTIIHWSDELKQTYADALASWDYDPEVGSIDTVFGGSQRFGEDLNGNGWEVAFTPILPDGTFLSKDTVEEYINSILAEAYADDGKVTEDELTAIDAQGRQVGNTFVQGIFAGIDDSQNYDDNGNWAEVVGRLMHFSGKDGAVQIAKDEIAELEKQFGKDGSQTIADFFNTEGINTQKEIDYFNDVTENAKTAEDAIKAYTDAKKEANEDSFSIPDTETLQKQISNLNSAIDSIQSAYDILNSAVEEYNTNGGTLSIDTIQSLLSLSDEYLACLQVENGQLSLNADAMAQLAQAKLDDAQATAITQAMTELQAIANGEAAQSTTNYIAGNAALMSSLAQLSGSYDGVAKAAMTAAQAQKLSALISDAAGKDKTATENVMKGLDTKLKLIQTTKASISAGNFGKVAGKSSSSSKGSGSGKSASDTAKEEIEAYMEYLEKALEGGRITYSDYVRDVTLKLDDMYHKGRITAKEYFDYVEKRLNQQLEVYKSVLSAVTDLLEDEAQKWQDKIDALNDENDLLEKQKDDYDSILSAVDQVYQDEIDRLNEQKDLLQDKIDAINDENDALELQRKKQEALIALDKARQQRNVKIYTEDRGYFYDIDQDAYKDAQQNLQDIKNEEVIKKLEDEQDALDDSIELLEKYRDLWNDIADAYKKKTNEALAVALWGENYEKLILQNRTQDIEAFKDKYLEIQSKIDDNKSLIDSYQEKVDYYNKLKEQWNEISSAYEKEQQRMYAAQILGANWEKDVLDGRLDVLNQFRDQYLEIQRQMTQAALDGARARNDAVASEGSGSGGSSGGGGSAPSTPVQNQQAYHVLHLVGGYSTSGEASSKISSFNGKGVYKYKDGKWYVYKEEDYSNLSFGSKSEADDYIKKHLSPAGRFLVKYYHNGLENGLVDFNKKDSNFDLVQKYGLKKYEVPAILKQGEAVMNQEQIKNLGEALRSIPTAATLYTTPDYTKMLSSLKTNNTPVMVTQSVNITLPNVTNNSGYENLTRELNRLKLDAYQFANRRN